jgi:hypothetical protein
MAQDLLRAEAEVTAEKMSNIACTPNKDKSLNKKFDGEPSKLTPEYWIEWGRIGYVTNRTKIKKKWSEKSWPGVMVGYADDHAPDVYRMFNLETQRVVLTRDIQWANWKVIDPTEALRIFENADKTRNQIPVGIPDADDLLEEDNAPKGPNLVEDDAEGTPVPEIGRNEAPSQSSRRPTTRSKATQNEEDIAGEPGSGSESGSRLARELSRLNTSFNPTVPPVPIETETPTEPEISANVVDELEEQLRACAFTAELTSDPGEPKTLKEALSGPKKEEWLKSCAAEVMNFLNRDAWKKVPMSQLQTEGRKPIPTKIIFKVKHEHDGSTRYKTRIVTKGFMQIPGVDYTESFSPVAMDSSVRTVIGTSLYLMGHEKEIARVTDDSWTIEMFDVEAAFLNAKMENKMYIQIPEVMVLLGYVTEEERSQFAIELGMSIYGNVDAALLFFA